MPVFDPEREVGVPRLTRQEKRRREQRDITPQPDFEPHLGHESEAETDSEPDSYHSPIPTITIDYSGWPQG